MTDCVAHVWQAKHPDAELDYAVDFEDECARKWSKWTNFASGSFIRVYTSTHASGFDMEATQTGIGRTGGRPPRFPTEPGQSVNDGSVTWTCRALSSLSLRRTIVGTPTWDADSGITVSDADIVGTTAVANISGGSDGQSYKVTITATLSDGNAVVQASILPVCLP